MSIWNWLRSRRAAPDDTVAPDDTAAPDDTGSEAASRALGEAQTRSEQTEGLKAEVERATGRAVEGVVKEVRYWNIGIPRPDPERNRQEISDLKFKVREAGILAQVAQLELESDKRILQAAKGLKSLTESIEGTNVKRGSVRKDIDALREELFSSYPPTE